MHTQTHTNREKSVSERDEERKKTELYLDVSHSYAKHVVTK